MSIVFGNVIKISASRFQQGMSSLLGLRPCLTIPISSCMLLGIGVRASYNLWGQLRISAAVAFLNGGLSMPISFLRQAVSLQSEVLTTPTTTIAQGFVTNQARQHAFSFDFITDSAYQLHQTTTLMLQCGSMTTSTSIPKSWPASKLASGFFAHTWVVIKLTMTKRTLFCISHDILSYSYVKSGSMALSHLRQEETPGSNVLPQWGHGFPHCRHKRSFPCILYASISVHTSWQDGILRSNNRCNTASRGNISLGQ